MAVLSRAVRVPPGGNAAGGRAFGLNDGGSKIDAVLWHQGAGSGRAALALRLAFLARRGHMPSGCSPGRWALVPSWAPFLIAGIADRLAILVTGTPSAAKRPRDLPGNPRKPVPEHTETFGRACEAALSPAGTWRLSRGG